MTRDEWVKKYKVIDEPCDYIDEGINPLTIWTELSDGEERGIVSGRYWVNRVCYYISEIPFEEGEYVSVEL